MPRFTDSKSRDWAIDINIAVIKRVRSLTAVDLMDVINGKGGVLESLAADPVVLADVLYAIVKPQADDRGVSDEQFGEALAGAAIETAVNALMDALVAFCPSPGQRTSLGRVMKAMKNAQQKAGSLVESRLSDQALENMMDKSLATAEAEIDSLLEPLMAGPSSQSAQASSA